MNGENENGKHDLNFFLDKQLQQKLLDADELFMEKDFTSNQIATYIGSSRLKVQANNNISHSSHSAFNGNNSNVSGKQQSNSLGNTANTQKLLRYLHSVHVCGWCPDPAKNYRKSENDAPPRSRGGLGLAVTRESLFSRDTKSRPQNLNNFVFRHYADPRKYIEQYRREHACYDTTNSSATKNEFLDSRRFYAYNQYSPLAVGSQSTSHQSNNYVPQPQPEMHSLSGEVQQKSVNQTPILHYSNRREQQRHTISANLRAKREHQYKLSKTPGPKNENSYIQDYTEEYIEALEINKKQRNSGSAKERSSNSINGTSIQKLGATKVNIPNGTSGAKNNRQNSSSTSETASGGHFHSHKLGTIASGPRTLDSLSCVVSTPLDKQPQVQNTAEKNISSNKTKTDSIPSARQRDNSISNISTSTPTLLPPTICQPPKSSQLVSQSASSSHNNGDKDDDPLLLNGLSHTQNGINNNIDDSISDSSSVSIGCLSTKCLGIEATVKQRPKLEASCTYHVFPNDFTLSQHQGYTPSLLWNPSKSALEKRPQPPNGTTLEFGLPGPFRQSPHLRPKTEESKSSRVVEFITKEFVADSKPINLSSDVFKETPRLATAPGLKTNTIKPDLPATFALQGFSKRPHFEAFGKKRGLSKTAMIRKRKENKNDKDGGRKSKSASTDTSNHSATGTSMKLKPVTEDANNTSNNSVSTTLAPVPYFKFWNSSLPPKSRERRRIGADKSCDLTMQQLAEMVLADENGQRDRELKEAAKKVLEQHSRSEEEQQAAAGIATGGPGITPSIHRITETKLLESLCRINQCPSEPIPRPLQLTLTQDDSSQDVPQDCPALQLLGPLNFNHSNSTNNSNRNLIIANPAKTKTNDHNTQVNSVSKDWDLEASNSTTAAVGDDASWGKKRQHRRQRGLSCDECISSSETSQSTNLLQTRIKSKSQDSMNRQWQAKHLSFNKKTDDNSLSHRRKIKHLIEQSRLKNRHGQALELSPIMLPETTTNGHSPPDPDLAVSATGYIALLSESQPENHQLKIKQCSTSPPGIDFGSKQSVETNREYTSKESMKSKEKSLQEKINNDKTVSSIKKSELSPSLSNVEDLINHLQTTGPSIPPLCGTRLGNQSQNKSKRKKMEKLSPLLSHPSLEKLANHMSIKVRISHLKYTKAGHIERSQTIHL